MTDPKPDPIATVNTQITEALAELREARTLHDHSPNADSEYLMQQAQMRLDVLLERRQRLAGKSDVLAY
jgi:hypothetical protein